jgi:hypothetical protein
VSTRDWKMKYQNCLSVEAALHTMVGILIKAMVNTFDHDLKDALVNLIEQIGGEKGLSLKQNKEFEKVEFMDMGRKA